MEYTIQKLSKIAGVSTRTLRYYDEVNLLKPARISSSGYRIYGENEVDKLQQILFYRELGVSLDQIKEITASRSFNETESLKEHHKKLLERRNQIDLLIANVEKTIAMKEGRIIMKDSERFKGFKKQLVEENTKKYGKEATEKYGSDKVEESNNRILNMTEDQYNNFVKLGNEVMETLEKAFEEGDPAGSLAQKAVDLHRQWLCYTWTSYSKEAHASLTQMYVDDERFTAYYDKKIPGLTVFLRDCTRIYTGMK